MVAIFTAPINLLVDYLFVDVLSAPTLDEMKLKKQNEMKQSRLNQMVKKAGETVRRASAVTVDAIKVAQKNFAVLVAHESMQIPETTIEAHVQAKSFSQELIREKKILIDQELAQINSNRPTSHLNRLKNKSTRQPTYISKNIPVKLKNHRSQENESKSHSKSKSNSKSKSKEEETQELFHLFGEFVVDLNEQRRALKPSIRDRYDSQWGVDPTGEFSKQWSASWSGVGLLSAEDSLRNEMKFVQTETKHKLEKLSLATDSQIGLEILHMFVMDVLGRDTPAAKIFLTKSQIE